MKTLTLIALACLLPLTASCAGGDKDTGMVEGDTDTDTVPPSLYDQLGGEAGIRAVVAQFLANVGGDASINWFFANSDLTNLGNQLHDQICAATGGGCTYSGGSMLEVHADMAITDAQFDALVGDLLAALDTLGIPYALDGSQTIDPLLLALVGMRGDIVTDAVGDTVYFNQLGGHAAVTAVVDTFVANVGADTRINGFFATTDLANLESLLVEQICEATGGYCVYSGRSMLDTHAGMCISESDFGALVEDLLAAFDTHSVPYSASFDGSALGDGLILALAGMQTDIVGSCD